MKDWFYAFFMAWGMFLAIPCPFPRWRESARGRMLVCLPLIGLVEGGLWALLVWLAAKLRLPEALGALCAAAFPAIATDPKPLIEDWMSTLEKENRLA